MPNKYIPETKTSLGQSYDLYANADGIWRKVATYKKFDISKSRAASVERVIDSGKENAYGETIPMLEGYSGSLTQRRIQRLNAMEGLGYPYPSDILITQKTPLEVERREFFSDGTVRIVRYLDGWITSHSEPVSPDAITNETVAITFGRVVSR